MEDEIYAAVIRRETESAVTAAVTVVRVPVTDQETLDGETAYRLGRTNALKHERDRAGILLGAVSEVDPDTTTATARLFDHHVGLSAVCWLDILNGTLELTTRNGTWIAAHTLDCYERPAQQPALMAAPPAVYDTLVRGQIGELSRSLPDVIDVHLFGHGWNSYTLTITDTALTAASSWAHGGIPGRPSHERDQ